jgi:putative exporter of polyketide antibiotics
MLISLLAYCVGAITAKRGFAGMLAGILAFLAYTITALAPGIKALKYPNYLSPFKYFNNPSVMANGLDWNNIAVLSVVCVILIALGFIFFVKRDIYQK